MYPDREAARSISFYLILPLAFSLRRVLDRPSSETRPVRGN
jgi:hypothetical protein